MNSISILGCGWLGLPLAQRMVKRGWTVKGSTTAHEKLSTFNSSGIDSYLIQCLPNIQGDHLDSFFEADSVFLNIPFRRDLSDPFYYVGQVQSILSYVSKNQLVIFTSSTSIYRSIGMEVNEEGEIDDTQRARALRDVEDLVKSSGGTILRLAGLYGGERKIGRFRAGMQYIDNGEHPTNLVHLDDCLGISEKIIEKDIRGETFNVCGDEHPTRKELYTLAAKKMGLVPPLFTEKKDSSYKIVNNSKVKHCLDYEFIHPNPLMTL